jgi:hypothetical protein
MLSVRRHFRECNSRKVLSEVFSTHFAERLGNGRLMAARAINRRLLAVYFKYRKATHWTAIEGEKPSSPFTMIPFANSLPHPTNSARRTTDRRATENEASEHNDA